ncbi:MAG: ABC transporter substrate-binding protein, partial [Eubacterium sp.]|nr:ABC transporter substrate-binding protein [Eubacterium sp.]
NGGEPVPCTAHDFVFGFRRLINPATKSKNADRFFIIKNAESISNGKISDLTELGVEALSDYRLVIRLEYADLQFLYLLAAAPAMPCNEEFYKSTEGQYGLNVGSVMSNGSFYLYNWNYDRYSNVNNVLILRRNKHNSEVNRVFPYGLNFFIGADDNVSNFTEGESHSLIADGEKALALIEQGYPYNEYENFIWGIVFNTKSSIFSDPGLRRALKYSFNSGDIIKEFSGYLKTDMFIPHDVKLGEENYRVLAGNFLPEEPQSDLKEMFDQALERIGASNINGLNLLVSNNSEINEYLSYITQKWQKELGFYCNIKIESDEGINEEISKGNFDLAMVRISGENNSPSAYLDYFIEDGSLSAYSGSSDYKKYLSLAEKAANFGESAEYYLKAEKILLQDAVFIPICFQTEYFFHQNQCIDIFYNPFTGTINYSKAKYFG